MRRIAVIGTGYVGLVTGTCFAELGNHVHCIDSDAAKVALLRDGRLPFYEPGLAELVERNVEHGRLTFYEEARSGLAGTEIAFIAVGTPMGPDGHADLRYIRQAAHDIAVNLDSDKIVVNKSTVPVETGNLVAAIVRDLNVSAHRVQVVSNPEFLREGSAIADFMKPDRIVIGSDDAGALATMTSLYAPLEAPIIVTDIRTAEMIKYTANAFLAAKISFINEIANICDRVGADVHDVVLGVGSDKRIGTAFMNPGVGFGGSCFPKDVNALAQIAATYGVEPRMLSAVLGVNAGQIELMVERLRAELGDLAGKHVGLLGLAFKPNTDDVRESPALALATALLERGATIAAHDPVAIAAARVAFGDRIRYVEDPAAVGVGADAIVVATDWSEYKQMDLAALRSSMRGAVLIDGRNIYDPEDVVKLGFVYIGIGRGRRSNAEPAATAAG